MRLLPVTLRYKDDPSGTFQYGLVAEEVARIYPELVTRDSGGKLQSVRYLEFPAMLINEVQKLANRLKIKDQQLAAEQREIDALTERNAIISALSKRLAVLERRVQTAHPGRAALGSQK